MRAAYEALSKEETRKIYDRYGESGLKQHQGSRSQGGGGPQDIFSQYVSLYCLRRILRSWQSIGTGLAGAQAWLCEARGERIAFHRQYHCCLCHHVGVLSMFTEHVPELDSCVLLTWS